MSAVSLHDALGRPTVHPFPARMAAGLALDALSTLRRPATILDPMAGSGTALAIGRANGHRCIGFDVDPLAVLIARVWTSTLDPREVRETAARVLERARLFSRRLASRDAYPTNADVETANFVRYWFDDYARRQLTTLSRAIDEINAGVVQDALWCAFSRLIIAKQAGASLALDLAHSRPHRFFQRAPRKPFRTFISAVERVIAGCVHRATKGRGPIASVGLGDARQLPIPKSSVDLVFTSPPYLNAIDYLRCSKFSLVWMGYSVGSLRAIRGKSIGAEVGAASDGSQHDLVARLDLSPALPPRFERILVRYIQDTTTTVREIARVMVCGAHAVYVVGENTLRGTYVPTSRIVVNAALDAGLRLKTEQVRELPSSRRYLPPPGTSSTALDSRMRREVILRFEKPTRAQRSTTSSVA